MKLFKLLAALILGLLPAMVIAQPAQAATCNTLSVCMWTGANYTGTKYTWGTGQPTYCETLNGWTINNNMESVMANHAGRFTRYYNSHNCTGTVLFWFNGSGSKATMGANANVVSSYQVCWNPAC